MLWRSRCALVLILAAPALVAKVADSWVDLPALPEGRQEVGVAALDGKVYVIGGILENHSATGAVSRYDIAGGVWEDVPPLPEDIGLHHVGAAALDGKVYAVGGLNASFRGVRSVFAFDPAAGEWEPVADLPWPRGAMGVAALDGRIFVAGGQNGGTSFDDAAAYSPSVGWEELPSMPTARNHLAAVGHDGLFYAIGGRSGRLSGAVEVYDPLARRWDPLAPMLTSRAGIAAAAVGREIFVFGGEGNADDPRGIFPQTESYDIDTGRWWPREDMQNPRHGIGAAAVDSLIYIPGGSPVQGFGVTDVHDAFVPGTPPGTSRFLFLRGDANRDGQVDISDPVTTVGHLFLGSGRLPCPDAADADDSGALEITDAIRTLDFLFRGGVAPSPPGPFVPGLDPSDDKLESCDTAG